MAKLFPFRGESTGTSAEPQLVEVDDEDAEAVFAALSSDTARAILSRLYDGPETASGVAEAADTSIQNARYHLDKLESAALIEPVDTWYSSRGTEMTVYAPTNEPLVVAAGTEESKGVLRRALERLVGAVGVLALASVAVNRLAGKSGGLFGVPGEGPGSNDTEGRPRVGATSTPTPDEMDAGTATPGNVPSSGTETRVPTNGTVTEAPTPTESPTPTEIVVNTTTTTVDGAADAALSIPPGALFFAGGVAVIAAGAAWWYWNEYRPMYAA